MQQKERKNVRVHGEREREREKEIESYKQPLCPKKDKLAIKWALL